MTTSTDALSRRVATLKSKKNLYNDSDVMIAVNNAVAGLYRWTRIKSSLEERPQRLRKFAEGIVSLVRDAVTDLQAPREGLPTEKIQILSDPEIMLCLQLAVVLVLGETFLANDSPFKASFLGTVSGALTSEPVVAEEPPVEGQ